MSDAYTIKLLQIITIDVSSPNSKQGLSTFYFLYLDYCPLSFVYTLNPLTEYVSISMQPRRGNKNVYVFLKVLPHKCALIPEWRGAI